MLALAGTQALGLLSSLLYLHQLHEAWLSHYKQPMTSTAAETQNNFSGVPSPNVRSNYDSEATQHLQKQGLSSAVSWEVTPEEVIIGRKLGEGYFGQVFLA